MTDRGNLNCPFLFALLKSWDFVRIEKNSKKPTRSLIMTLDELLNKSHTDHGDFLKFSLANSEYCPSSAFTLSNDTQVEIWDTGILVLTPEHCGDLDLVLSSGIHGNETAPIEICAAICRDLLQEKITANNRVMFIFGNPPAINAGKRELVDNLNRLFSGHHANTQAELSWERKRAAQIEQFVSRFFNSGGNGNRRALYDLHTAIRGSKFEKFAVYPYLHGKPWSQAQFEFLAACDVHTVLLMQTPASTFSYYASHSHGADAFTIELGKVRPFGQNDMTRFAACDHSLRRLVTGQQLVTTPFAEQNFNLFAVNRSINKQTEQFALKFANDIENFTQFPLGTLLAVDTDVEYRVEVEGEAIIFPNANVALGQRAMLLVKPVSILGQTA